jgi:hypothetical protein
VRRIEAGGLYVDEGNGFRKTIEPLHHRNPWVAAIIPQQMY